MDLAEGQASNRLEALDDDAFEPAFADIMAKAREMGLKGFGGGCFATAVVTNRVIFGGAGTLAVGLNAPLWENASHVLGHAAVLARGAFWDADGHPKSDAEVESWGMLDPEDSDCAGIFAGHGLDWSGEADSDAGIWEFDDEAEFLDTLDCEDATAEREDMLRRAIAVWAEERHPPSPCR